jgi:AcrR family transcriptional regulator
MVRPRFAKLPPEQQESILAVALEEFASRGYYEASLNRVIEAAGISKGSMYYYFDGKEDLYVHVTRGAIAQLFARVGVAPDLEAADADSFWSLVADYYLQLMRALAAWPQLAALLRGWTAASRNPAVQQAQGDLERASLPWIEQALVTGQRVGAVRTDVPASLLIAVALGMGEAMDLWLMATQPNDDDLPGLSSALVDMIRRAVGR